MIVGSVIELELGDLSGREMKKLKSQLTFFDNDRNVVTAYRELANGGLVIPRGAWSLLPDHVEYEDRRVSPSAPWLDFRGVLDLSDGDKSFTGQQEAVQACLDNEQGIVVRGPGSGKTQIALALIAQLQTRSLVLVHTEDIFNQWIQYAKEQLSIVDIGTIQGKFWEVERLTIAMVQTVRSEIEYFRDEIAPQFGALIIDECHHAPASTWEEILNCSPSKYRIGFTATDSRADGMQPLMKILIGPVIHRQAMQFKIPTKVVPLKSGFYFPYRGAFDYGELQRQLIVTEDRNRLIAQTAVREMTEGNSVLILSRRIEHLENLFRLIDAYTAMDIGYTPAVILTGKTKGRKQIVKDFRAGKIKCLLATQLADEALDVPRLSRVILTYPGKHDGRIIQQIGRALREFPGKEDAIIYDIVDNKIGVLHRQWKERLATYNKLKIPVEGSILAPLTRAKQKREANRRLKARMKR